MPNINELSCYVLEQLLFNGWLFCCIIHRKIISQVLLAFAASSGRACQLAGGSEPASLALDSGGAGGGAVEPASVRGGVLDGDVVHAQPIAHSLAAATDLGRYRLVRSPEQEVLEGGAGGVGRVRIGSCLEQIQHALRLVDLGRLMQRRVASAIDGVGIGTGGKRSWNCVARLPSRADTSGVASPA